MSEIFQIKVPVWELILRGSVIYWFLFLLFRFVLRRDAGSVGIADILLVVLIADAAQNGMSADYRSITEALILIGTIAGWNFWIDWMSFRHSWFSKFSEPPTVALIRHGVIQRGNLRREMITEEELDSHLRQNGVAARENVKHALLEPDGSISVIRYGADDSAHQAKKRRPG